MTKYVLRDSLGYYYISSGLVTMNIENAKTFTSQKEIDKVLKESFHDYKKVKLK